MSLTRRPFLAFLAAAALLLAGLAIRATQREIAVLRTYDGDRRDYYASVWVVDDDAGFTWIRAHGGDRVWFSRLLEDPEISLRRTRRSERYSARVFDDDASRRYIAPWFREKYGLADRWREWTVGQDVIPIRLQAR